MASRKSVVKKLFCEIASFNNSYNNMQKHKTWKLVSWYVRIKATFPAYIWLILRYFKLKLSVKMKNFHGLYPLAPLGAFRGRPQTICVFTATSFRYDVEVGHAIGTKTVCPKKYQLRSCPTVPYAYPLDQNRLILGLRFMPVTYSEIYIKDHSLSTYATKRNTSHI